MSTLVLYTGLLDLPNELIEEILTHLHPLNIVTCRRICKCLALIIDTSVELKLRTNLAIDGYLLGHKGDLPVNQLLDRMKSVRQSLETFDPPWRWHFNSANTRYDQYEICDGLWGRSARRWRLDPFRSMSIVELAPPDKPGEGWEQRWADLGMNVTDFSFQASSDLLVLVESKEDGISRVIHFRTISENIRNPLAAAPCFVVHKHECPAWDSCLTLLHNDYVALHFATYEQDLAHIRRRGGSLVYNWRTGKLVMPYLHVSDLAFLSDGLALVLFDGTGDSAISLGICSLKTGAVTHGFELPFPHRTAYRARLLTHPGYGGTSPAVQARLVQPDPAVEIIVVDIVLRVPRIETFLIVMSTDLFLRKFRSLQQSMPHVGQFPWRHWGPDVTRWLPPGQFANSGFRSTFGSKMLLRSIPNPSSQEDWGPTGNLILLDFNPRPILLGAQNGESGHCRAVVFRGRSTLTSDSVQGVVESSLPFRAFIGKRPLSYEDVHLDGSTMVCRNENSYSIFSFLPRDDLGNDDRSDVEECI